MTQAIFRLPSGEVSFVAAVALESGEVVQLSDGRAAIVQGLNGFAIGDTVSACAKGQFDMLSASATLFSVGDPVYWDTSANLAIVSPGAADDLYLGVATKAKVDGDTVVRTDLNEGMAGAGSMGQRTAFTSGAVLLVHDDATEVDIIPASENPNGLLVLSFQGVVTEAPAGSSEDQLILDLQDEDDNVLSQITTTDTTPDAAGDIVIGTRTLCAGSTGDVASVIPAGKAAKVLVSQATAGTPAGEVRVSVAVMPLI